MKDAAIEEAMRKSRDDFRLFSRNCLMILDKVGKRVPLNMNRAQQYVHQEIERQKEETGKVRALILKGRQQGISTYVGARFYWRTIFQKGQRAFIIAHEQQATDNLFNLVKRYHENNPMQPSTGATNAKELVFDGLDGGYKVATAGTKDTGRSATAQLLHGSEFAFWNNPELHLAGIGNTVADQPGTEIILESTANGVGNTFHQLWQDAEAGLNAYVPIFVPWFWQDEYRADISKDVDWSPEEIEYKAAYGLTSAQMMWRRNKIASFGRDMEWLFDQEYPACASLAFITATSDPFIPVHRVMTAVNSTYNTKDGALVIGCDPAEFGADRTAIVFRRGRVVPRIETYKGRDTMEVAGIMANIIHQHSPDGVFVDSVGIGAGVRDRLRELGFQVIGVHSGTRAADDKVYANKRAEMWGRMKEWMAEPPVRLPNDDELISDLTAPSYRFDSAGRLLLEKKEDMRKRGVRSPDVADALALTFAEPVIARVVSSKFDFMGRSASRRPASRAGY